MEYVYVHAGDLLKELRDLVRASAEWEIVLEERCDCGELIRHFDGGNYHRRCLIVPVHSSEIAVTFSSTCVIGLKRECDYCHYRIREHDRHEHHYARELVEIMKQAMRWVGEGWAEVRIRTPDGHEVVKIYEN